MRLTIRASAGASRRRQLWLSSKSNDVLSYAKTHKPDTLFLDSSSSLPPSTVSRTIRSPEDLLQLQSELQKGSVTGTLLLDTTDWRIIPAENLVALAQQQGVTLFARTTSVQDAEVLLGALEVGVDGLVLQTDDAKVVAGVVKLLNDAEAGSASRIELTESEVISCKPLPGLCDRVCVDTTSVLTADEGMLVGSFSRALFLVKAEVDDVQYIASRPFRVNAGAVHSYATVSASGKTAYLSEIRAGSEVLVASSSGATRSVSVGRSKVERRPMVLVEARGEDGDIHSVVLQNAETVKLFKKDGGCIAVTDLKPGDRILVHRQQGAKHTGITISEQIVEV